ncbi:MAG: hypothetical protein IJT97_00065 [Bacteroidaceae bacterium]|nr:hypothetical protein [Bacteroidaceae bacterium]
MNEKDIHNETCMTAEPAAALTYGMSPALCSSGILSQIGRLDNRDKQYIVDYLRQELCDADEEPFCSDEQGRIVLTSAMTKAADEAQRAYSEGRCLTEDAFKQRFAKWL